MRVPVPTSLPRASVNSVRTSQNCEESHSFKIRKIHVTGISEGGERENRAKEKTKVITLKNFPKLMTEIKLQIQETWRIPGKINTRKLYLDIVYSV